MIKIKLFHGTFFGNIKKFNLEFLEGGEHSFGIGIYFTKNQEFCKYYSETEDEIGYIYEIEIKLKKEELIRNTDYLTVAQLKSLIPNLNQDKLSYLLSIKFEEIIHLLHKEYFSNYNNKDFICMFVLKTGLKACYKEELYNGMLRTDFCVMNPEIISILNKKRNIK